MSLICRTSLSSFILLFKNRDSATIVADIIKALGENPRGKRKTKIMQSANLNYEQLNKYLDLLLRNGYVILQDGGMYKPTQNGLRFLKNLQTDYLGLKGRI